MRFLLLALALLLPATAQAGGRISASNSSTAALTSGSVFTGAWEVVTSYSQITVMVGADVASAADGLSMQFSADCSTAHRPVAVSVSASTATSNEVHTLAVISKCFRIVYTNGGTNQATFALQTKYHTDQSKPLTGRLTQTIGPDSDVILTRATIVGATGGGVYDNVAIDSEGHLEVAIHSPTAAFGETLAVSPTPQAQVTFAYGILPGVHITHVSGSGATPTTAAGLMTASTTAAANSSSTVTTARFGKYRPGQGVAARLTAAFSGATTGAELLAGVGTSEEGFFFGHDETDGGYGILHRKGGAREIQLLTVSTKSSTAENITITLDGVAVATVAVTNGASASVTAAEIAAHDYLTTGTGWHATSADATVTFSYHDSTPLTGAFTLSGASTAVGTFSESRNGVTATDTWTPQQSFSIDTVDGGADAANPSGITVDPEKINVYEIQYQYLGAGAILFSLEAGDEGQFTPVHRIEYAGANATTSLANPSMPICWEARNIANTSAASVSSGSGAVFVEGVERASLQPRFAASADVTAVTTAIHHILSVRNRRIVGAQVAQAVLRLVSIAGASNHNKPMTLIFLNGPTYSTPCIYSDVAPYNIAQVCTTTATLTGGTELFSIPLTNTGSFLEIVQSIDFDILPGSAMTVGVRTLSGTGGEASFGASFLLDL